MATPSHKWGSAHALQHLARTPPGRNMYWEKKRTAKSGGRYMGTLGRSQKSTAVAKLCSPAATQHQTASVYGYGSEGHVLKM
jgi:hypothetical protein